MSSLKRPSSSGISSSRRNNASQQPQSVLDSEDLFCSSPDDEDIVRAKEATQQTNKEQLKDDSTLGQMLDNAGFILSSGNSPNILKCERATFQRSLSKALTAGSDMTAAELLSGLEKHLEFPHRLKWSLLYTETAADCEVASRGQQDSLIRLLLNIDILQPKLVTLLTDTLLTLAYQQSSDECSLPALVLGNLRWLDHVVEPQHLTDAVLLVLEAATTKVQQEMIQFIPNIITDEHHARAADALTELYSSSPSLCPAILDALQHLTLSEERLQEVHHSVLRTLQATDPPHLPCVLKFLLHNTPTAVAYQVLCDVREKLHLPPEQEPSPSTSQAAGTSTKQNTENADISVLVFSTIRMALLLSKHLANAWLKAIDDEEVGSMRGVDLFVLAVVHDALAARRRPVYSILRNKIRAGLQYDALLRDTLHNNPSVMREYFDSMKKLAGVMLRSPEPAFSQFGSALYRSMFEASSSGGGGSCQQQELVVALLAHLGDDQHVRLTALTLLADLAHAHTAAMTRYAIFLKSSLEQLERLSLQESRCLLDAVSAVAAPDTALHSDLAIHTRKMLNNTDIRYKRLGVLSAVLTLKNCSSGGGSSADDTSSSDGTGVGGEDVLEVVGACTANCPPASALFMDELASTILRDGINTRLERWLTGKLEESFETVFIQDLDSDTPPLVTQHTDIKLELTFDLEAEEQARIAVNLGVLVERLEYHRRQEKTTSSTSRPALPAADGTPAETILLTLAPHFRLLRMLVSHLNGGELSAIDGLLGCPVYYPHQDLLQPLAFSALPAHNQSVLLSCLFFTDNWFRELLNAFATQKMPELKAKVYSRLRNLLSVEQQLRMLLPLCAGYIPHLAASHIDPGTVQPPPPPPSAAGGQGNKQSKRKKKKKKKKGSDAGDAGSTTTLATQSSQLPSTAAPPTQTSPDSRQKEDNKRVADLCLYKAYLRELHVDVFCLLFRNMSLDTELQSDVSFLSIPEAEFLLTDLNVKLSHVFGAAKRSSTLGKTAPGKDVGFWHLDLFTAEEVATQAQRFVKPLCVHLDKISTFFKSLIEDHDGVLDCSGVLNHHTLPVARVQGLLLTALYRLLNWPALYRHPSLYNGMLRTICRKQWSSKSTEEVHQLDTDVLLWGVFCYARKQLGSLLELGSGVLVVRLLEAVTGLAGLLGCSPPAAAGEEEEEAEDQEASYGHKLGAVVSLVLRRSWTTAVEGTPDKGPVYNQRVSALLQCWLRHSPRPLEVISLLTISGLDEYLACTGKDPVSQEFPTLNKGTLVIYFSCLISHLSISVKKAAQYDITRATQEDSAARLTVWRIAVEVYSKLFHVVKLHHSRHLLSACLKYARPFLELFLNLGMPLMDSCLKSHNEEVCKLLKTLQGATRILQIVCTESKVKKDVSLTCHVPLTRRSLASLVFRVKAMLARHNCSHAFWLGVLKNRNLEGEIIATQQGNDDGGSRNSKDEDAADAINDEDSKQGTDESDEIEGLDMEDDRSDVELDDDDEEAMQPVGRKRKAKDDSDEEGEEPMDVATDYSASF